MLRYVYMCVCDCDESSEPKLMSEAQQKKLQRVPKVKQLAKCDKATAMVVYIDAGILVIFGVSWCNR